MVAQGYTLSISQVNTCLRSNVISRYRVHLYNKGGLRMKRRNIVLFALLVAMALITYTQAWTINPITQESTFYEAQTSESDRTISGFRSRPLGKNKILITFTLSTGSDSANVTLQPLDQYGNILNSTGPGSLIQFQVGGGSLQTWRTYPTPDTEMFFFYEFNSTHASFPGPVGFKVLFQISSIVLDYETCLIEVRDY